MCAGAAEKSGWEAADSRETLRPSRAPSAFVQGGKAWPACVIARVLRRPPWCRALQVHVGLGDLMARADMVAAIFLPGREPGWPSL